MNSSSFQYKIKTATCQTIINHLKKCADCFVPRLHTYVNVTEYGKKIFSKSTTFESWDGNNLIGLVAVYYNNYETKTGYITNVSVLKDYQGFGIASKLIGNAIDFGKENTFILLALELDVDNTKAFNLYKKHGFVVVGKIKNNILMNKDIK